MKHLRKILAEEGLLKKATGEKISPKFWGQYPEAAKNAILEHLRSRGLPQIRYVTPNSDKEGYGSFNSTEPKMEVLIGDRQTKLLFGKTTWRGGDGRKYSQRSVQVDGPSYRAILQAS